VKFVGPKGEASYIVGHQPKSFDWRARGARKHPWKRVPDGPYQQACEALLQIIDSEG
jgi:mRNA interferase MazF